MPWATRSDGFRAAWARARARRSAERDEVARSSAARAKASREARIERVRAQAGEPVLKTILRTAYLSACVLFDGVVLLEIVRALPGPAGWVAYFLALAVAIPIQARAYRRWLETGRREGT